MDERKDISDELDDLMDAMKRLEIRYEQYFSGTEKREPMQERERITYRIRRLMNLSVTQTDLRFRIASVSSRFNTYNQYWTRILRLMDEGRYHRGGVVHRLPETSSAKSKPLAKPASEVDRLFGELQQAQKEGKIDGKVPSLPQLTEFLDKQRAEIRKKYGDHEFEFAVQTNNGKPKIIARRKD